MFDSMGKVLILVGIFIVLLGLALTFWDKIPLLGRLPLDIYVQKGNFRFFFPIMTCLILSVVLTIAVNLILRLLGK